MATESRISFADTDWAQGGIPLLTVVGLECLGSYELIGTPLLAQFWTMFL